MHECLCGEIFQTVEELYVHAETCPSQVDDQDFFRQHYGESVLFPEDTL